MPEKNLTPFQKCIKWIMCFHMEYGVSKTLIFVHLYRMTSNVKVAIYLAFMPYLSTE